MLVNFILFHLLLTILSYDNKYTIHLLFTYRQSFNTAFLMLIFTVALNLLQEFLDSAIWDHKEAIFRTCHLGRGTTRLRVSAKMPTDYLLTLCIPLSFYENGFYIL